MGTGGDSLMAPHFQVCTSPVLFPWRIMMGFLLKQEGIKLDLRKADLK